MSFKLEESINEQLKTLKNLGVQVYIKREDRIHPFISGNKYRKLKYNVIEAKKLRYKTLLTFGGAYSNHIAAVASAGKIYGFKTIGVIRGEELEQETNLNDTLRFAKENGMSFKFVSREIYRNKTSKTVTDSLKDVYGEFYLIPEGGTNTFAIKGCEEILTEDDFGFNFICCPVGTGGTFSGLINCSKPSQQVLGFPALKGSFLHEDISKFANKQNWELINDYHFGGYAKINATLVTFINTFRREFNIPLDPIYTGKMLFGIMDLIQKGYFPKGSKILAIHTGGLQGIAGMNKKLEIKNLPKIEI